MFNPHITKQFDALLDRRLNEEERLRMEAHLQQCADCRAAWETHLAVWQQLSTLPATAPSTGFAQRVINNLDRVPSRTRQQLSPLARWIFAPATGLALASLMIAVTVLRQAPLHTQLSSQASEEFRIAQNFEMLNDFEFFAVLDQLESKPSE